MKKFQVTCRCTAYTFPHRISGGKCDGSEWAIHVKQEVGNADCRLCNCNQSHSNKCDVGRGVEGIEHCEVYQGAMLNEEYTCYPINAMSEYEEMYNEYYGSKG